LELIYLTPPHVVTTSAFFFIKFSFVFFLFILNIYLIFTAPSYPPKDIQSNKELPALQSGFGNKKLKGFLSSLGYIGGFLSALITVKNEFKDIQIGKIDQLMEAAPGGGTEIRKSIDKDREEHQRILSSIDNNREELFNLHIEKAKLFGHNDRLLSLHNNLKNNIISYQEKSLESTAKLSDLGILDQLIKQDTKKFGEVLNSLILNIEPSSVPSAGGTKEGGGTDLEGETPRALGDSIKESSTLPFNFELNTVLGWFEGLNGIKKIAVSLIISKSVVFSALTSIIFIFYGNILIEKYDLINRYPKLAKIIQLRQKFQKYYFNYYCFLILLVVITEVAFALAILLL
jgi:hypothetical protein